MVTTRRIIFLFHIMIVILSPHSATTVQSQNFEQDYSLLFQIWNRASRQFQLKTLHLDESVSLLSEQPTRHINVHISPDNSRYLFSLNSSDDIENQVMIFDSTSNFLDSFVLPDNNHTYVWGWLDDNRIVLAEVEDQFQRFFGSDDYFVNSQMILELERINSTQQNIIYFSSRLLSINPDFTYLASPLVFSHMPNSITTEEPQMLIWEHNNDELVFLDSIANPVDWWITLPDGSNPLWISEDSIIYLAHNGDYSVQTLNLYNVPTKENQQLYQLGCEICDFIAYMAWDDSTSELMFWEPSSTWTIKSIDIISGNETTVLVADTVPRPLYISPDDKYLATSILGDTNTSKIIVINPESGEIVLEHSFADDNINHFEVFGWLLR